VEGGKRAEVDCAGAAVVDRSRSSEAAGRDAMGAAGSGLGEGSLVMAGRCRSAEHGGLAGAGQGCCMVLVERWRLGRGEACRSALALTAVAERGVVCGYSPIPACCQSSARPVDL
jgi:hypothetical protein